MRYDKQKGWFYNQHSCFLLQYHLIFVTKYRHPVLTGEVKEFVYSYVIRHFLTTSFLGKRQNRILHGCKSLVIYFDVFLFLLLHR